MVHIMEEAFALAGIVPELMAEHAKGARGISKVPGDLDRGPPLDEVGPQGFILAVEGLFGGQKEPGLLRSRYVILATVI
jgi:hypothetical protein